MEMFKCADDVAIVQLSAASPKTLQPTLQRANYNRQWREERLVDWAQMSEAILPLYIII